MIVVAGLAVAALLAVALTAAVAVKLLSGTAELSEQEYASEVCAQVIEPAAEQEQEIWESEDVERVFESGIEDEDDATTGIDALQRVGAGRNDTVHEFQGFSDDHRLSGSDGEEFQQQVDEAVEDWDEAYDSFRNDLDDLDPADEDEVQDSIVGIVTELSFDLPVASGDVGGDLRSEMSEADSDCGEYFSELTRAAYGG